MKNSEGKESYLIGGCVSRYRSYLRRKSGSKGVSWQEDGGEEFGRQDYWLQ